MRRKDAILAEASRAFGEKGYAATSMRDLARALNLQSGSLYAHISSKDDLLWEIARRVAERFLAEAAAVPPDLPPAQRLAELIRRHLDVVASEIQGTTVFFHEWHHLSPERRATIQTQRDIYETHFQRAIADGAASGVFHVDDVRLATLFVLSALNWTYQWLDPDGRLPIAAIADQYTALILGALTGATRTIGRPVRPACSDSGAKENAP